MNEKDTEILRKLYYTLAKKTNDKDISPFLPTLASMLGEDRAELVNLKNLLNANEWPKAVDSNLICDVDSDDDKLSRAEGILELIIERNLQNKSFLDFGCGEGHVPLKSLAQEPIKAVGYDIEKNATWDTFEKNEKLLLTTDMKEVEKFAPYDVILLYDVLDHMESGQVEILTKVKELLADGGAVYVRFHPYCSRHALHLYHDINKAYIHLIFTEKELTDLGYKVEPNAKVVHPIVEYGKWIKEAGLITSHSNTLRERVEPFFGKNKAIKERVRLHFTGSTDKHIKKGGFPTFQLEQQFCDYVLKK